MASLKGFTVEAVDATLAEFDAIGREAFLVKYDFGEAKGLYLVRDGKRYDSKAIVGARSSRAPSAACNSTVQARFPWPLACTRP